MSIQKIREALEAALGAFVTLDAAHDQDRGAWSLERLHEAESLGLNAQVKIGAALALLDGMAGEIRAEAFEEAAKLSETWFDRHRPKQPEKSRFDIYDIEHWAKSATRLVAEDIRALAALTETKR